jgi:hypothetical protein
MRVTVQVRIEPDDADVADVSVIDVATIERRELAVDSLGLCIAEAKTLLAGVQDAMVTAQAAHAVRERERCDGCGRRFAHKDTRTLVMRTLFGTIQIASPRWWSCNCGQRRTKTFSPIAELLDERSTPELRYLQTKFAALMSYRLAGRVLNDLLPLGRTIRPTDLARQVAKIADRLDSDLPSERFCYLDRQADPDLPRPELPLVVAIDGGFIHSSDQRSRRDGWFQAIVGSVTRPDGTRRRFGFVPTIATNPRRVWSRCFRRKGCDPTSRSRSSPTAPTTSVTSPC